MHKKRMELPKELILYTNMAAVLLFWDTNMYAMTSCHVFSTPTDYPIESAAYNSIQVPERLVQLVERKFAVREVEGSSPRPAQHSGS